MRKIISLIAIVSFLVGCGGGDQGQLVGVEGEKWNPEKPLGMVLVPGGAYIMGKSDDDAASLKNAPPKTVTVRSFYMDETEITNSEYRQFVFWVRDSIVRTKLAILAEQLGETPGTGGIGEYAFLNTDPADMSVYEKYMYDNYYSMSEDYTGRKLNKEVDIIWDTRDYPDVYYAEVMDSMYIPIEEAYNGIRTPDVTEYQFRYKYMDIGAAARAEPGSRAEFIEEKVIQVYPDTTVWITDYNYSYNEPMHNDYFWHTAYDDYPVVGVTWHQAKAFARWRTLYHNSYRKQKDKHQVNAYRLPTEAEWEYAARGGLPSGTYPWGGPYLRNDRGCFMANFKPLRGDYAADQALYTVEAKSYEPNDYGLYNMAGNVSEWVLSSYNPSSFEFSSSMNPWVNNEDNMKKVIRGGSWKDVAYFLQVSTRDYEYADSARSYIGFRTVQDYMGTDLILNQNR